MNTSPQSSHAAVGRANHQSSLTMKSAVSTRFTCVCVCVCVCVCARARRYIGEQSPVHEHNAPDTDRQAGDDDVAVAGAAAQVQQVRRR